MDETLIKIYKGIVECKSIICEQYGEVMHPREKSSLPRGFYTEAKNQVEILVVGKNPGHMLAYEKILYKDLSTENFVKAHLKFASDTFMNAVSLSATEKKSTTFHSNLLNYLAFITDKNKNDIFKNVAYTNLVKCSTKNEQAKIKRGTMSECFARHLINEIHYFKPKVLIALGREVEGYFNFAKTKRLHFLDVVYIKHPSYHYRKDILGSELEKIKSLVHQSIKTKAFDDNL